MPNREIYRIQIVSCGNNNYWYSEFIGALFYAVVEYNDKVRFKIINNHDYNTYTVDYDDVRVVDKITKVLVPQVKYA